MIRLPLLRDVVHQELHTIGLRQCPGNGFRQLLINVHVILGDDRSHTFKGQSGRILAVIVAEDQILGKRPVGETRGRRISGGAEQIR